MKNKKQTAFFFVMTMCFSTLFACGNDSQMTGISVDPTKQEKILLSEVFDSVRYVRLETTDSILIKQVSTIRYANNSVYIFDEPMMTLFSFDANTGKCQWKIQNIGQGPGEYTRLTDFDIDEKNERLYLFCSMEKIQEYDLSGNFITEYHIGFAGHSFACAGDYMYIYAGNHPNRINGKQLENYYLLIYNKKDGSLTGHIPFEDNPKMGTTNTYNHSNAFYHYNDSVRFYCPYSYSIYSIKGNDVDVAYSFDFGEYNLRKNLNLYLDMELKQTNSVHGLNSCWENDRYLSFNIMMSVGSSKILYDRKENRLFSGHFYDDVGGCSPQFVQATDDFILGFLTAELCHQFSTFVKRENSLLKKIVTEITEDDNPVLFFYYFKK